MSEIFRDLIAMATDLNAGYSNNINVISIRTAGTSVQRVTDRAIDVDGDGAVEAVSVVSTPKSGNKITNVVTTPTGAPRTVLEQTVELDGGIDTSGTEFTEGNE